MKLKTLLILAVSTMFLAIALSGCGNKNNDFAENRDYSGSYVSTDSSNKIEFVRRNDGMYNVSVSLKDICDMKGEGNDVDGAAEIVFTDPNGDDICSIFFPEGDKCILRITQSKFDKIKEQTDFTDFVKQ